MLRGARLSFLAAQTHAVYKKTIPESPVFWCQECHHLKAPFNITLQYMHGFPCHGSLKTLHKYCKNLLYCQKLSQRPMTALPLLHWKGRTWAETADVWYKSIVNAKVFLEIGSRKCADLVQQKRRQGRQPWLGVQCSRGSIVCHVYGKLGAKCIFSRITWYFLVPAS